MKRLIASSALLALLATACAETGAQPLGPAPVDDPTPSASGSGSPTASPLEVPKRTFEVWFTSYGGTLFVTHRTQRGTASVELMALEALLAGPTAEERAEGVSTEIPPDTGYSGIAIGDGVATVGLSKEFLTGQTPATGVARLAQVVYTLTQNDTIDGVLFEIGGVPLTNLGGYEITHPQSREDFEDQLPVILVEAPSIGDRVSNPVTISGSADVFEAVVSITILNQDGQPLASTFTTATCGTGCRGTYSTDVDYFVESLQPGAIHVYEVSAMDGTQVNDVYIPVTLTP